MARSNETIRWERLCWLIALVLGFIQAWGRRHESADGLAYMGPDGISYLDIGDAYMRGDWYLAVNAMWSPFYSWLVGLTLHLIKPSPFWEFTVVRLLNFLIFIFTLFCFAYFLRTLRWAHRHLQQQRALPEWSWLVFGYAIFIWTSLFMNRVSRTSPDLLLSGVIFLTCALLLRIRNESARWSLFIALGVVLGIGYLSKTIMFPLAFIFAAVALLIARRNLGTKAALLRAAVSLIVFLTLALPFVILLSAAKQRFTIGDSARLNYAWYVNGTTRFIHWQGEPAGSGTPLHATRKIFSEPEIYEFAGAPGVTYPPWYDPSYWYEGVAPHFNLRQQVSAVLRNLKVLYGILFYRFFLVAVGFALFVLFYQSARKRLVLADLSLYWFLIVPCLIAIALYLLINIEPRYLAAFLCVLALSFFASLNLSPTPETQRLLAGISFALILVFIVAILPMAIGAAYSTLRDLVTAQAHAQDVEWQVADGLDKLGVQRGERVAVIGNTMFSAWPRLAHVRVVAEMPETPAGNTAKFWLADEQVQQQALTAFAQTGARVVVAEDVPLWGRNNAASERACSWKPIGGTDHFVCFLPD